MNLNGKVVLVTGASRGIGCAIAKELGSMGALIVGTATTDQGAEKISAYLNENKIQGQGLKLNVTESQSIEECLKTITDAYGAPNILINNAAITQDNLMLRCFRCDLILSNTQLFNNNLSNSFFNCTHSISSSKSMA